MEIREFRAKLKSDNCDKRAGEWVYGHYCELQDGKRCIPYIYGFGEVEKGTVSQWTGLKDIYGKKIYGGDIVHMVHRSGYAGMKDTDFGNGVVKYDATYYGGAAYRIDCIGEIGSRAFSANLDAEVVGNIHDNPDKLTVYEQVTFFGEGQ